MLVNIIVRTFRGRELLLAKALRSIEAQDTTHAVAIIVAVDGQPIDQEKAGIAGHKNLSIVSAGQPGGRSAGANAGLAVATGDAIGFLDDDDWFEPNHVEVLATLLEDNLGAAAAYAASWEQEVSLNPQNPAKSVYGAKTVFFRRSSDSLDLVNTNLFPIQSVLFRRATLLSSGAHFSTELDALEDWLFWQQLLIGEKLVSTSEVTSTFLVPLDEAGKQRRSEIHRDAMPAMLALRRFVRVPVAVADDLMRMRYAAPPAPIRTRASSLMWRDLAAARLLLLSRSRPRWWNKVEYALLHVARSLWRLWLKTPAGREEAERARKIRARKKRALKSRKREAGAGPAISVSTNVPSLLNRFDRSGATWRCKSDTAVFTSCNWAYMDKALVLAESVAKHMPDTDFHILLVDTPRPDLSLPPTVDRLFCCADLRDFTPAWAFKHTVVELSTAVKPLYADVLLDEGYDRVVYFDPDTMLLSTPRSIGNDLKSGDFLLTPHLHRPAVTRLATETFEISAMAHGIYNLGFFALNNTPKGREVVSYWAERCRGYSYGEVHRGIFTDQKWANHFPVFFGNTVVVSSNPGLNTAVWNAEGRSIIRRNETFHIDGVPIEMFHFSGWDAGVPEKFGLNFLGAGSGAELLAAYSEATARYNQYRDKFWPYAYYDDGLKIQTPHRLLYRRDPSMQAAYSNPYASGAGTFQDYVVQNNDAVLERYDETRLVRRHF